MGVQAKRKRKALIMAQTNFSPVIVHGTAALAMPGATLPGAPDRPLAASRSILCYASHVRRRMTILLCETYSTYADVRSLMKDRGQRRFFGVRIDGVAFGNSGALYQPGSLLELERSLGDANGLCYTALGGAFRPQVNYLYWGSISRAAVMALLDLYRANPGWPVKPFAPAYRAMLDAAYSRRLPAAPPAPESSFFMRLEPFLTPMQLSTYRSCLADQLRIPQGIITKRALRTHARA